MKINKYSVAYFLLAIAPVVAALLVYRYIPETVTIAEGLSFSTERYRVFILPVVNFVFAIIIFFLFTNMDMRLRERVSEQNEPPDTSNFFQKLKIYLISFFDVMCFCSIYGFYALDWGGTATAILMCRGAAIMIGIGGLLMGRKLPTCTKRSILCLRWSYTIKSDNVWYHTHKAGAILFYIAGIFSIFCAILITSVHSIIICALAFAFIIFILYCYSKKLYFDEFK